ncbi:MAG: hypothetical protein AAF383_24450 [Cyanobacteria bacterium P01_A01_bin.83]
MNHREVRPPSGSAVAHGGDPQDRTASPRRRQAQGNAHLTEDTEERKERFCYKSFGIAIAILNYLLKIMFPIPWQDYLNFITPVRLIYSGLRFDL